MWKFQVIEMTIHDFRQAGHWTTVCQGVVYSSYDRQTKKEGKLRVIGPLSVKVLSIRKPKRKASKGSCSSFNLNRIGQTNFLDTVAFFPFI